MKKLITLASVLMICGKAYAFLPSTSDRSNSNFSKAVSTEKSIKTCSSERIDVTRIVKTTYLRKSRMTLKKFDMLPITHGVYHDLVKDLEKTYLNEESVTTAREINSELYKNNCEIYTRKVPRSFSYDYKHKTDYVVFNTCSDVKREQLPETTQKWLDLVDANCEL